MQCYGFLDAGICALIYFAGHTETTQCGLWVKFEGEFPSCAQKMAQHDPMRNQQFFSASRSPMATCHWFDTRERREAAPPDLFKVGENRAAVNRSA